MRAVFQVGALIFVLLGALLLIEVAPDADGPVAVIANPWGSRSAIDVHAGVVARAVAQQNMATADIATVVRLFSESAARLQSSVAEASLFARNTSHSAEVAGQSSHAVGNVTDHLHDEIERFVTNLEISYRFGT